MSGIMKRTMRISGCLAFLVIFTAGSTTALGQRKFPAPVHPDTLPTLIQSWALPASLAPYVTNSYAPRLKRKGSLLYVYDHHGRRLAAVRASNGKVEWHAPVRSASDRAFAFTPLVYKNQVFVASHGHVFAFNALNGKLRWEIPTKGIAVNAFARSKHRIFLPWIRTKGATALRGVSIWAIDARARGRVEWSKKFPGKMGYLTGDTDGVYYASDNGVLMGLTSDRGTPMWQIRVKGRILSPPILKKGKLYVSALRKKAGWKGTSIFAIDVKTGKMLWNSKLATVKVHKFLMGKELATVDGTGRLVQFDDKGKRKVELTLRFSDEPTSVLGTAVGKRVFVFSSHSDGNGYIWLVDMEKKKVLTAANALGMKARSLISAAKMLYFDGADGNVYGFRLDRSAQPKRPSVPPEEFAREMLARVQNAKAPIQGLAPKLAGLGNKAMVAVEPALTSENPFVVAVAAETIGLLGARRSLPALLKALKKLTGVKPDAKTGFDPLLPVLHAIAKLRHGQSINDLKKLLQDASQSHLRRRAAYVALGSIGTPAALGPVWAYRATRQVASTTWAPVPNTTSYSYKVEEDVVVGPDAWPEKIRKRTTLTIQTKAGQVYTASLSPYLGGYNDIWIGRSDLAGKIERAYFTGLTKAELLPNRRIRVKKLVINDKDLKATLSIELRQKKKWVAARPVTISLKALAADRDGDRLPDNVERRLHLAVGNADSDGDGLKDGEDLNPLASGKLKLTPEQLLYREAFFTYFSFLQRRGIVVVDPGDGPSFEVYGRKDPVLSLRRRTVERLRKEVGLHAVDYVTFGGPYPEGGGSGDALPDVVWNKRKNQATIGMDILRSGENAVAYNITLKKVGRNWVVNKFDRVWTTN